MEGPKQDNLKMAKTRPESHNEAWLRIQSEKLKKEQNAEGEDFLKGTFLKQVLSSPTSEIDRKGATEQINAKFDPYLKKHVQEIEWEKAKLEKRKEEVSVPAAPVVPLSPEPAIQAPPISVEPVVQNDPSVAVSPAPAKEEEEEEIPLQTVRVTGTSSKDAKTPAPEPVAKKPPEPTAAAADSIIPLEGKRDFVTELKEKLRQNPSAPNITFGVSPDVLKRYMISAAEGFDVKGGSTQVGKNNQIVISGLRISKLGVGVTLDLALNNDKDGIAAKITKFHRDFLANSNKASSREEVGRQIENIDAAIKNCLDYDTYFVGTPWWKTKKISIAGDKILIEFDRMKVSRER